MKVALVGFGYWGQNFWQALKTVKEPKLKLCVCDTSQAQRVIAQRKGLTSHVNLKHVLPFVDVCIVMTPEITHFTLVRQCLLASKHVLVAKPLSNTLKEAKALVRLASVKKKVLMVDNTFLFDESFALVKKKIEKKAIGKVFGLRTWRYSPNAQKFGATVVTDLLPHDLSIINELGFGEVKDVRCNLFAKNLRNIDDVDIYLRFKDKKVSIFLSWVYPQKKRETVFYGSKGLLLWKRENKNSDSVITYHYDSKGRLCLTDKEVIEQKSKTLRYVLDEFFCSIISGSEPKSSGRQVLKQVALLERIQSY